MKSAGQFRRKAKNRIWNFKALAIFVLKMTGAFSFQERSHMNVFEVVKENVTARQAAEAYGLKVGRTGMACCPFHLDKSPSMKLDERYYCFGCGAT